MPEITVVCATGPRQVVELRHTCPDGTTAYTRSGTFKLDNTGQIAQSFGRVQLTPTTLLINKRGEIVKRYVGEPDFVQLHTLLEKLLAEAA